MCIYNYTSIVTCHRLMRSWNVVKLGISQILYLRISSTFHLYLFLTLSFVAYFEENNSFYKYSPGFTSGTANMANHVLFLISVSFRTQFCLRSTRVPLCKPRNKSFYACQPWSSVMLLTLEVFVNTEHFLPSCSIKGGKTNASSLDFRRGDTAFQRCPPLRCYTILSAIKIGEI